MQVILLEKVHNLGSLGDQVKVKPGYARNCLVPQRKAVLATMENITKFEAKRIELEKAAQTALESAKARGEKLMELVVTIAAKAGDEGKLYGSISNRDIAQAISAAGAQVTKSEILLPHGPIRHTGEHEIFIQVHSDVKVPVKVHVVPE